MGTFLARINTMGAHRRIQRDRTSERMDELLHAATGTSSENSSSYIYLLTMHFFLLSLIWLHVFMFRKGKTFVSKYVYVEYLPNVEMSR